MEIMGTTADPLRIGGTAANDERNAAPHADDKSAALMLDERGMIKDCDAAGEILFGYKRGELGSRHVSLLLPQLGELELVQGGRPNPQLSYSCRIGRQFRALTRDSGDFIAELSFYVFAHADKIRVACECASSRRIRRGIAPLLDRQIRRVQAGAGAAA